MESALPQGKPQELARWVHGVIHESSEYEMERGDEEVVEFYDEFTETENLRTDLSVHNPGYIEIAFGIYLEENEYNEENRETVLELLEEVDPQVVSIDPYPHADY